MSDPPGWTDLDRRNDALDRIAVQVAKGRPMRPRPTPAELDVLRCLSHGMTQPMTADTLGLSVETVRFTSKKACRRLAAKNRSHAVAICIRAGYIA